VLTLRQPFNRPDVWNWFSHSYGDGSAGSFDQTGRMDAVFRQMLDIEYTNWRKYAVAGSRLMVEGASQGGWATLWRETSGGKFPAKTAPYTAEGGGLAMVFGINDLGTLGGATTQLRTAWQHALRSCISRWRASFIAENDTATGALQPTYGGTWTAETAKYDQASSGTWRFHATTAGTVTITLPSDYAGEPVVMCFIGRPGTNGGTVTFSGTAGVTGTIVTNDVMPAGTLTNCPVIKRVTTLTSANASQTIIATVTANVGLVYYDCSWLESKSPPPVIVANIPRLTSTGYSTKYPSWTAATGTLDGDVQAFNADLVSVIGEFDGMVQLADIDAKMSPTGSPSAALFSDGLHPNDLGAALCADALLDAVNRLTPNQTYGIASQMNTPAAKAAAVRVPTLAPNYYTAEYATAGTVTGTAGTMFAFPFPITESRTKWDQWAMEVSGGTSITVGYSLRFGMYNDLNLTGYPDTLLQEVTVSGALSTSTSTGVKTSTGGGFIWRPDPGFYWLVTKVEVVASATTPTLRTVVGPNRYMPNSTTAGSVNGAGYQCWTVTGLAAGVFPSTFPTGGTLATSGPIVTMRRAA
jgi:hypothetical protein